MTLVEYIREKGIQQTHIEHFISPPPTRKKWRIQLSLSPSRIENQWF